MDLRTKRLMVDLKDFQLNAPHGYKIICVEDDYSEIMVSVPGFDDTPFEGGTFNLKFIIPREFPLKVPKIVVCTPVWHPNICVKGTVCMDLLDVKWSSGTSLIDYAAAVRTLLSDPNPDSPLNPDAAEMLERDANLYNANAKLWSNVFAGANNTICNSLKEKLGILEALGLTTEVALRKGVEYLWEVEDIIARYNL